MPVTCPVRGVSARQQLMQASSMTGMGVRMPASCLRESRVLCPLQASICLATRPVL